MISEKARRYRERHRHPCSDCGAPVFKKQKRCKPCDKKWRKTEMSKHPVRLRHGYAIRQTTGSTKPEFYIWTSMIQRCTNPKAKRYNTYGGRGIKVCARWLSSFDNFIADMGPRPPGTYPSGRGVYTIERKDNDGDYTPDNCIWATYAKQSVNRTNSRLVSHGGRTQPLAVWCEQLGLDYKATHQRLSRGWSVSKAFGVTL